MATQEAKKATKVAVTSNETATTVVDIESADYSVVSALDHDQVRYEQGAVVRLTSKQAQALQGVVVAIVPVAAAEAAPS